MMHGILTVSSFISIVLFPWPLTALLVVITSVFEPLVPFAAGLLFDTLYYSAHSGSMPLYTVMGALVSTGMAFLRSRMNTNI